MDKTSATKILAAILQLGKQFDDIDMQLRNLPEGAERQNLLKALAKIMLDLDSSLLRPLVRQHPELDPDR